MSSLSLAPAPPRPPARTGIKARLAQLPGAFYLLVALCAGLSVGSPYFLTAGNLTNILLQTSVVLIVALGMTLVILTEGIDLSLGPVLGLAAVVMALLAVSGWPLLLALGAAVLAAAAVGTLNGVLVACFALQPFVVTLGTFGISLSLALALTDGNSVVNLPPSIRWFNEGAILGVPTPICATAAVFAMTWVILHHTRFGRYIFAIGGNRTALVRSGVPVTRYHVMVYAYAAALTGIASFIMTARANAAHPTFGVGIEFDAIAAAVLGGASFSGGRASLFGTVAGALAVTTLRNGLNLIGVQTEWQAAAVGAVILLGVAFDTLRGYNR